MHLSAGLTILLLCRCHQAPPFPVTPHVEPAAPSQAAGGGDHWELPRCGMGQAEEQLFLEPIAADRKLQKNQDSFCALGPSARQHRHSRYKIPPLASHHGMRKTPGADLPVGRTEPVRWHTCGLGT